MKRLFLSFILLLASCGAPTVNSPEVEVRGDGVVNIGFISPQTGTAALYGVPALRAAEYAVQEINDAGGIMGMQVNLIVEDGQCNGKVAASAAQKLIQTDGVNYLLAGHCSTESMVTAPIANKNEVFLMAGLTSTPDFPHIPYVYRTSPSSEYYMAKAADVAFERGVRRVAVMAEQLDFPQGAANDFSHRFEELGGEVLGREDFAPGSSDFRTELTKMTALKPDAFMIESQGPDTASLILQQLKELGIELPLIGGPIIVSEGTFSESSGLLPDDAFSVTVYSNPEDNPRLQSFVDYMDETYGGVGFTLFYIAGVYDNVYLLKDLIEQCDRQDPACMDERMQKMDAFEGISGTIRFDEEKNPLVPLAIKTIKDGKEHLEPID